jgi:ATP-dependent Zn protease
VQARITGQDFDIEANSPEVQSISYKEPTEWTWDISPTESGKKQLHLTITALFKVEGEEATRQIESFDRTISVNVTWNQRLSGFISTNWQWLWTAILVPIVVYLWKRRNKSQENGESTRPRS